MFGCEQPAEPVPPMPHGLMAEVAVALQQQVLDILQAEQIHYVDHHQQADCLGRRVETPKRRRRFNSIFALHQPQPAAPSIGLTKPAERPHLGRKADVALKSPLLGRENRKLSLVQIFGRRPLLLRVICRCGGSPTSSPRSDALRCNAGYWSEAELSG